MRIIKRKEPKKIKYGKHTITILDESISGALRGITEEGMMVFISPELSKAGKKLFKVE